MIAVAINASINVSINAYTNASAVMYGKRGS